MEATVARWLKKVGDAVSTGEALVELETNKANLEVAAEQNGILSHIDKQEGEDVLVGESLGMITAEAEEKVTPIESEQKVTPLAQRIARDHKIDPSQIPGSGAKGRVLKEDVEKFLAEQKPEANPEPKISLSASEYKAPLPVTLPPEKNGTREERLPLSRRRRTTAQKLVETQHTAAMLTTFNDVDMSAVMKIRQARKQSFKEKYGVSLGIVSFLVKASILALKNFPQLNAELQGEELIVKHYYDIGIAIGDEQGLVVPILRDADRMTFVEIEKSIQKFVQQIRDHTLSLQDIMGGTFTITNGGVFGSLLSTPILNGPEVGILGLHRIEDRPVAVNGEVVIRPMMYMALSYDHRVVDGREAVQFLARIKEAIQDPEILLLGL